MNLFFCRHSCFFNMKELDVKLEPKVALLYQTHYQHFAFKPWA